MASLRRLAQALKSVYQTHPVKMNVITDICCQRSLHTPILPCSACVGGRWVEDSATINLRRLVAMTAFGSSYTGFAVTYIYGSYKFILPAAWQSTAARKAFGSTVLDNFFHCPMIYTPTFYITTGMMQGQSFEDAKHELVSRYWETTTACWVFWFPAMLGNFYLLPPNLVVACMQCENFAWNIIIDYIAHRGPEVASEYVVRQIEKIPLDQQLESKRLDGGGLRGVNVLADAFKKELAARFQDLNQQLTQKDKTIAQLRFDIDILQTKYDQMCREKNFTHQLDLVSKTETQVETNTDSIVISREDLKVLMRELIHEGIASNATGTAPQAKQALRNS